MQYPTECFLIWQSHIYGSVPTGKRLTTPEKIETCGRKKEEGNTIFKKQKYERASKRYEKALSFVKYDSALSEDAEQQAKVLKMSCSLNNVACK
ncbi:Peptidyl-prolyl cis-trans isomerase, FKBP-type [Artemisia annua]|uniref:Peptidyl-prolyl cis-trans isomerase, FKBP-type n=1 Tax=Artemisia annua TaxID=35608 RepID=A0A2U1MBP7_ARTAN|nr:Peptidyl-prolyl cis-trans isomerase, FKBP-type [Artemisia annua]